MSACDYLIIGGGPAGLSAARGLARKHRVTLLEKAAELGGAFRGAALATATAVVAPTPGPELLARMCAGLDSHARVLRSGAQRLAATPNGWSCHTDKGEVITANRVVLACGAKPRDGGMTHDGRQIWVGPNQMTRSDWIHRRVAILGGGDNAIEFAALIKDDVAAMAIYARRSAVHRGMESSFMAVHHCWRLGPYTAHPMTMSIEAGGDREVFDAFVVMYGWEANLPQGLEDLALDGGFVRVDGDFQTSLPGVYAIGDICRRPLPSVWYAINDGYALSHAKDLLFD
mgnify:CR=1 FL=1|jgi:thioredoxin reductase